MSQSREDTITQALLVAFPPQAIKTRQGGGGKGLSYVEGHTIIRRLIDATGNRFDVRVLEMKSVPAGPNTTLFTATVELCIDGLGCRQHMGVQAVNDRGGEDLVKGCITDALKKAATLFGVGLDLYGPDYEAGEIAAAPAASAIRPAPAQHPARPAPRANVLPNGVGNGDRISWTDFWSWVETKGFERNRATINQIVPEAVTVEDPTELKVVIERFLTEVKTDAN